MVFVKRFAAVLSVAVLAAWPGALVQAQAPDLILHNGKVVTVDPAFSIAEGVAIRGDRFVAVGTNDAVRRTAGQATRVIDLRGRTVIPGLMDGHLHNAGGGPGVNLSEVRSMAELLAALEARVKAGKPGDLVVSNSDWHEAQLREKRLPHRRDLDRIAPDNPVVLVRGGHEFIVNSAAMKRWNISRSTPVPPGGEIGHDADGELNGELVDTARGLVKLPPPPKLAAEEILAQMKLLNAAGLTGIRIPGQFQFGGSAIEPYRMFQQLKAQGKLTIRVNYLMRIFDYSSVEKMRETIASWNVRPDEGDEWLRIGGMKTLVDGGFEGGHMRTAYEEPFVKGGEVKGIQVVPLAGDAGAELPRPGHSRRGRHRFAGDSLQPVLGDVPLHLARDDIGRRLRRRPAHHPGRGAAPLHHQQRQAYLRGEPEGVDRARQARRLGYTPGRHPHHPGEADREPEARRDHGGRALRIQRPGGAARIE